MCTTKIFLAMIFNETKGHVNTFLGMVGGCIPPLCPRLPGPYLLLAIQQFTQCITVCIPLFQTNLPSTIGTILQIVNVWPQKNFIT